MKHYELLSTHEVSGTDGLDTVPGTVIVVGVHTMQGLDDGITEPWTQDADSEFLYQMQTEPWYSFRYVDHRQDTEWGICTLPGWAFDEIRDASGRN